MTEPYPSTEVESKLKHLFRSLTRAHRAYKDTRNHALTLLHRASAAVLTAVLVYKALTYLLFLPAMNGIWSLTLRWPAGVKHCVLFPCSSGRWGISATSCSPRTGPSCFTAPCSSPLQMYS